MQNIRPLLQPYSETLSMFWDFEEKWKKKFCLCQLTKNCGVFFTRCMLVSKVSTYMAQDLQGTYYVLEQHLKAK